MAQGCGNCNYQGKLGEPGRKGIEVYCLVDNKCHNDSFKCDYWNPILSNITPEARIKMATDLRNSEEAKKVHQETIGVNREANTIANSVKNAAWLALGIAILSFIISAIALFKGARK